MEHVAQHFVNSQYLDRRPRALDEEVAWLKTKVAKKALPTLKDGELYSLRLRTEISTTSPATCLPGVLIRCIMDIEEARPMAISWGGKPLGSATRVEIMEPGMIQYVNSGESIVQADCPPGMIRRLWRFITKRSSRATDRRTP
jgi:hypothetical protein